MKNPPNLKTPAEALKEIFDILAAIAREAGHRGIVEIVDLAGRANKLTADLFRRETD
jgi:hypothetical protein